MYKLFLHPTEKPSEERKTKAFPLIVKYLRDSAIIRKEFLTEEQVDELLDEEYDEFFSSDKKNPDLLVKKQYYEMIFDEYALFDDYCAFEFKFGMDLVSSLNSGLLEDELTRMKDRYSEPAMMDGRDQSLPLYLIIVNEYGWDKTVDRDRNHVVVRFPIIPHKELMRAVTIAQNLNIRVKYCNSPNTFAKNVFDLIRFPPKEVDLGQRFVKKSGGSEFNRSLQAFNGVTRVIADKIEEIWVNWDDFIRLKNFGTEQSDIDFEERIALCFTTSKGRFMKANMEKFLRKVSGE